ncbi:chymotrypsin-2-like isoform X1 [Daphnia pulicaria]|uniref:chymotrypsin-2-like isoform X1 n=2 Tax=Daphnia pulicaria TaxID=35523 RepID=UPI001EEB7883|nr:chymotrypsin-2-like isoform X1 [Daphnia pulicaria]
MTVLVNFNGSFCDFFGLLLILVVTTWAHSLETEGVVATHVNDGSRFVDRQQILKVVKPDHQPHSCMTFDGQPGTCLSARECYPYTKVHQSLSSNETWVIGSLGTCHLSTEANGRQVYGVCCNNLHSRTPQPQSDNLPPGEQEMGRFKDGAGSRIVNGKISTLGEYPFMVGIMRGRNVFCGGSLLDANHVLTAAHCVSGLSSQDLLQLTIVMGAVDINDSKKVIRHVKSVIRHRQFDNRKLRNDIALLTLDSPVEFTNVVSPVCLHDDVTKDYVGKDVVTAGWGRTYYKGPKSPVLQKVTLKLKSLDDCRRNLGVQSPGGVPDHYICAWAPNRDSCAGDSGGPLMLADDGCQIGIVSWGIGCATNTYGVYTRISSFRDWIEKNKVRS